MARRLIVLAHELVEAVVGVGRRVLAVGDGRDVSARVVGVGIRRPARFPCPDLPRGRCGRGIVVLTSLKIKTKYVLYFPFANHQYSFL